jgi:hypothetical protein
MFLSACGPNVELWKALEPDPAVDEVVRNYPIRQPLLWLTR